MFKAIWKGIKWFFKQPDDSKRSARGKPMFSRPNKVVNASVKTPSPRNVEGKLVADEKESSVFSAYQSMVELTESESNAIEVAQSKRFGPNPLTEADINYILENSDIVHQQEKVIKAINLALNFQYVRTSIQMEELLRILDDAVGPEKDI